MTPKDLLEIIILVIGGGGGVAAGAFAFAMNKYSIEITKHTNSLEKLQLEIKNQNFESGRKQQ